MAADQTSTLKRLYTAMRRYRRTPVRKRVQNTRTVRFFCAMAGEGATHDVVVEQDGDGRIVDVRCFCKSESDIEAAGLLGAKTCLAAKVMLLERTLQKEGRQRGALEPAQWGPVPTMISDLFRVMDENKDKLRKIVQFRRKHHNQEPRKGIEVVPERRRNGGVIPAWRRELAEKWLLRPLHAASKIGPFEFKSPGSKGTDLIFEVEMFGEAHWPGDRSATLLFIHGDKGWSIMPDPEREDPKADDMTEQCAWYARSTFLPIFSRPQAWHRASKEFNDAQHKRDADQEGSQDPH